MSRVKRGTARAKRRKGLLSQAKSFAWRRSRTTRLARPAILKAGVYAYRDRRTKKRAKRALWQTQIGAATKEQGMSYSVFIGALTKQSIALDRKILSSLAQHQPKVFAALVAKARG